MLLESVISLIVLPHDIKRILVVVCVPYFMSFWFLSSSLLHVFGLTCPLSFFSLGLLPTLSKKHSIYLDTSVLTMHFHLLEYIFQHIFWRLVIFSTLLKIIISWNVYQFSDNHFIIPTSLFQYYKIKLNYSSKKTKLKQIKLKTWLKQIERNI